MHKRIKDDGEEEAVGKVPRIVMDYFFMSEEDSNANKNPTLVMIGENSGERMDWLVRDMNDELKVWVHLGEEKCTHYEKRRRKVDHGAEGIIGEASWWKDHDRSSSEGCKPQRWCSGKSREDHSRTRNGHEGAG